MPFFVALLIFLLALPVSAQNPVTAQFPASVASADELPVSTDRWTSNLDGSITSSATSIDVDDASGLTVPSLITIDLEGILCESKTANQLTSCTRGFGAGSTAVTHSHGATVTTFAVAYHLNAVYAEVIAIQAALGANLAIDAPITVDADGTFGTGSAFLFGDGDTEIFESADDVLEVAIAGETFFTLGGSQTTLSQDPTATTGDSKIVARGGAGQAGSLGEWQDENSNPLTTIDGIATLGTETLDEGAFPTHAEWDVTGDFLDSGGNCAYTHSSGVGTCTQVEADLALTPAIANVRYSFTYTISGATGDAALSITTAFALTAVSLSAADGTFTAFFTSAVAPTDFVIDGTSASGGITIDDLILKQVIGGDLVSRGTLRPFVGPLEPYDCVEARWGDLYFDTTDGTLCLCANDGADEWQKMADGTTDCSI